MHLDSWWRWRTRQSPDAAALTFDGVTRTFAEVDRRVAHLVGGLRTQGCGQGDRIGYLGWNHPALLETLLAAARLRAVFVPVNARLSAGEVTTVAGDAGLRLLVAGVGHRAIAQDVAAALPGLPTRPGTFWDAPAEPSGRDDGERARGQDPGDLALLMYTSGTTGRPKGVMLTHANLFASTMNAHLALDLVSTDVTLACAPLFHIGGLNILTLVTWQRGGHVVLAPRFDPTDLLRLIAAHRVTTLLGVPAMFAALLADPGFAAADLSSLRLLLCGGSPMPPSLAAAYRQVGLPLRSSYGLTECAPMVLLQTAEQARGGHPVTGMPLPLTAVRIADPDGRTLPAGCRGELRVHGPNVMAGYWGRPDETAAAFDEQGWLRTGDVAVAAPDGSITVVDRFGDLIISGGENISPAEVEAVLADHPAVAEVAVLGVEDARWGETVAVAAVLHPGASLDLEEVRTFAAERLARYKLPRRLALVPALPRNAAGKVLRPALQQVFTTGAPADPDGPG